MAVKGKTATTRCGSWRAKPTLHPPRLSMTLQPHKGSCASGAEEMLAPPHQVPGRPRAPHSTTRQTMSPNSSTLASAILSHSRLGSQLSHGHQQCLSSCPCTVTQHPVLPTLSVAIFTHIHAPSASGARQEGKGVDIEHFNWICASSTDWKETEGKSSPLSLLTAQPWRKALHPTPDLPVMQQQREPTQDKAGCAAHPCRQFLFTLLAQVNPQSLTRPNALKQPLGTSSHLYFCILNSCLRRPNVLQHCCCVGCLLWLPFLAKVQPRCRCHHPAQMCRAHSSQLVSNRAIHVFLENIMKKSCQSWMHIISN